MINSIYHHSNWNSQNVKLKAIIFTNFYTEYRLSEMTFKAIFLCMCLLTFIQSFLDMCISSFWWGRASQYKEKHTLQHRLIAIHVSGFPVYLRQSNRQYWHFGLLMERYKWKLNDKQWIFYTIFIGLIASIITMYL